MVAGPPPPEPVRGFRLQGLDRRASRVTARLHSSELPPSFFSDLGPLFLGAYHRSFAASPHGVALTAVDDGGAVIGFLVGTVEDGAHYRWLVRSHAWRLAPAAFVGVVRRPLVGWRFARTRLRRYARGATKLAGAAPPQPRPGVSTGSLTHVAVSPDGRGRGVGRALTEAFVEQVRRSGTGRVQAKTLAGPEGAAGFYASLGWRSDAVLPDVDGKPHDRFLLEL